MFKKTTIYGLLMASLLTSCTISRNSMREANYQLWLQSQDLEYSSQLTGEARQTKILFVDWNRLFKGSLNLGNFGNLPIDPIQENANINALALKGNGVLGGVISGIIGLNISSVSRVEEMAMYDLMQKNPGYDMVIFPKFEAQKKWYLLGSKSQVQVQARLAKLKVK